MTILAILTYIPMSPLFSIKIVSIIFDYICAFLVMEIIGVLVKNNKNKEKYMLLGYSVVIFLPTVFLNSACWGQADSIYTAFVLMALLSLFKKKYTKSFIYLGIAFSFKLQTVFILPIYILIYISERKFSLLDFGLIPLVDFIMCIPAIIFGKSIKSCINVYIGQTNAYSQFLTMNFPNVYSMFFKSSYENHSDLIATPNEFISTVGVCFTVFIFIIIAILVFYKKVKFDNKAIIEFGVWSVLICTFFLPHMHDRYMYMADIIGILYLIYNKRKFYIPLAIELISLSTYMFYLFDAIALDITTVSIVNFVLITLYSWNMVKTYFAKT